MYYVEVCLNRIVGAMNGSRTDKGIRTKNKLLLRFIIYLTLKNGIVFLFTNSLSSENMLSTKKKLNIFIELPRRFHDMHQFS